MTKTKRGGPRPGAGRPKLPKSAKVNHVALQIQVSHHYATAWRKAAKRRGIPLGQYVCELLTSKTPIATADTASS